MKKRVGLILIVVLFVICLLCCVACNKKTNVAINYGYYFFSTSSNASDLNKINSSVWIKLTNDNKWEASDNTNGNYEVKGNAVILRQNTYSYMICTYENGIMTIYGTDDVYLVQNDTAERINKNEYNTFARISTPEDLLAIADSEANASISYVLTNDIDFTDYTVETTTDDDGNPVTTPVRTVITSLFAGKEYAFSGILDGAGHTIRGLTIKDLMPEGGDNYPKGLISKSNGGIIRNLTLEDIDIVTTGGGYLPTGLLVGEAISTTISNVKVKGSISYQALGIAMDKELIIGGLVGIASNSHINYCSVETAKTNGAKNTSTININNSEFSSMNYGGILGVSNGNNVINQCYFRGNVSVSHKLLDLDGNTSHTFKSLVTYGGILGRDDGSGDLTVSNCYVDSMSSNLSCQSANANNSFTQDVYAGGIIGYVEPNEDVLVYVTVQNCALSGNISGQSSMAKGSMSTRVGGIAGYLDGTITNSFISGDVTFESRTASEGANDSLTLIQAGICPNAELVGCFQIGRINGNMFIEQNSNVTYDHVYYSAVRLTLAEDMRNCLYDGSEDSKVTGNIYNKSNASLPESEYMETRNKTRDNSTLKGYPESAVASSTTLKTVKTLLSIGFKPYRNIMNITAYPENAWNMSDGSLPKLHWV
ncbi:MAG: hypothetical protein J5656_01820 [Clostridia bacterium]|nr:hypothetical protein [Clostridia bacterium]